MRMLAIAGLLALAALVLKVPEPRSDDGVRIAQYTPCNPKIQRCR